jgi:hypothetical protein
MLTSVRYLDLLLVALALPIFLAAGLPLAGWAVGGGAWVAQRALQEYLDRRASASKDPRTVVGLLAGSMIARGWFVAIAVFLVGLSDNEAGLAAAVLVIALFTVYFTMRMILRPFETDAGGPARAAAGASDTNGSSAVSAAGRTQVPAPTGSLPTRGESR